MTDTAAQTILHAWHLEAGASMAEFGGFDMPIQYDSIFAEQLENLGQAGDLLIAISGSGNSENVLRAVAVARRKGMKSVGLTGFDGGRLAKEADLAIVAASHHMGRVEDVHTVILHAICYYFMEEVSP